LNAPSLEEIDAFTYFQEAIPVDATVLTHIEEGHLVSTFAKRKNFYDEHFLLAPQSQERYEDARSIYLSQSQATVLTMLHKYGIKYVAVTPKTLAAYPSSTLLFESSECFDPILQRSGIRVYEVKCVLNI
jgi:uncharacterized membrane protein